jgi:hypothetical protein
MVVKCRDIPFLIWLRLAGGGRRKWSGGGATAGAEPERNAAHRAANGSQARLALFKCSPNEQAGEGEAGADIKRRPFPPTPACWFGRGLYGLISSEL